MGGVERAADPTSTRKPAGMEKNLNDAERKPASLDASFVDKTSLRTETLLNREPSRGLKQKAGRPLRLLSANQRLH